MDVNPNFYNLSLMTDADLDDVFSNPKEGVYFLPSRTGKGWFHQAVSKASALMFLRGDNVDGTLVAIGAGFAGILENHKYLGFLVRTQRDSKGDGH